MGGVGSGNWVRWNKRRTLDAAKKIDIAYLKKQGAIGRNCQGTLHWTLNGKENGFIQYTATPSDITLQYRIRFPGEDEWQPVNQTIHFDKTPCHFGGVRYWFVCSGCQKRVRMTCGEGKLFLCRHCYELPYGSQNESKYERVVRRYQKVMKSISNDSGAIQRPKGMHQKTYDKKLFALEVLDEQMTDEYFKTAEAYGFDRRSDYPLG